MPASMQNLLYGLTKLCDVFDRDVSGSLSYDEFRLHLGIFATYTSAIMAAFDTDYNGHFNGDEAEEWDNFFATTYQKKLEAWKAEGLTRTI